MAKSQREAAISGVRAARRRGEITAHREADLIFQARNTGRTQESIQPGRGPVSPELSQSIPGGPTFAEKTQAKEAQSKLLLEQQQAKDKSILGRLKGIGSNIKEEFLRRTEGPGFGERAAALTLPTELGGTGGEGLLDTAQQGLQLAGEVGLEVGTIGGLAAGTTAAKQGAKATKAAYEASLKTSANNIALKHGGNANEIFEEMVKIGTKQDINKAVRDASKDPQTLLKWLGRRKGTLGTIIKYTVATAILTKWGMLDNVLGQAGFRAKQEIDDVTFSGKDPAVARANIEEDRATAEIALKTFRAATWIDVTGYPFLKGWQAAGDFAAEGIDDQLERLELIANKNAEEEGTELQTVEDFEKEQKERGEVPKQVT